jgi:hypothetical protein
MNLYHKKCSRQTILFFLMILSAASCFPNNSSPFARPSEGELFKPPTQLAAIATLSTTEVPRSVNPTPPCQNGLAFISDITIPDGTVVNPGAIVDKTWEVENIGTCNWSAKYELRLVGGSNLSVETSQPLYPARAGSRAPIRIQFKAPTETGTIHSAWRAYSPDGQPFGDPIYLQIIVSGNIQ